MNKFALWVGGRDRVSFPVVSIRIQDKKRSLGVFDKQKSFQQKSPSRALTGCFSMNSFSSGLYFPTTVTKLQEQTGLFVVGS